MTGINNPIPSEWNQYVTQSAVGLEVVPAVFYDTATYTDNTTTSLSFFGTPRATADLSNLQQAGMLPNPQSFLIQNIRVFFKVALTTNDAGAAAPTAFASVFNDVVIACNTGILRLQIGEKRYGPWPLWSLPASTFAKGTLATAGAEAANITHNYAQLDGPLYALFPHLMIAPLQNFFVTLEWPAGPVDLTGNLVMQVLFDGQLARAIQ